MTPQAVDRTVPAEPLIDGTFRALVPAPAFFALAHFTYQPGAFFPPAKGNGPVVFRVLDGVLEFEAQDVATKTPAGGQPQDMTPGAKFTVSTGDQLVMPGDVLHSARTVGDTAARILGLAVFGAAPAQEFPPGITFDPLVLGPVGVLPAAPAVATVTRLRPPPGAAVPIGGAGPRIVQVESGTVRVTPGSGDVAYWHGTGPFAPPSPLTAPIELAAGDGILAQSGSALTLAVARPEGSADGAGSVVVASVDAASTSDSADETVRGYFREVVDAGNPGAAASWVAAHAFHHDRPDDQQGLDGLQTALRAEFAALTNASTTVADSFGEGDVVLHRWARRTTQSGEFHGVPASGRSITASGITVSRVRDHRVAEDWEAQDVTEQIRQAAGTAPIGDLDAGPDDPGTARQTAARFLYDLWHAGDLTLTGELFDAAYTNHTPLPGQREGVDGIRQFVNRWHAAFPDVSVTADLLVAAPGQAAVRWTSRGHHRGPILGVAPSGRYVTISGITVLGVRGGRITDSWQQWGVLSFLDQTGPAPADPAAGVPAG
jgi:predicted ester cyclase